MLHNLCIDHNNPCDTRGAQKYYNQAQLKAEGVGQKMSDLNRMKICNWLWNLEV